MAEKDGNPATQILEVGESQLISVEITSESASDDDDDHRPDSNNVEEISTTKEANLTLTTPNNLMGAYRHKGKWWSEIRNPLTKRKHYLGTFNTPEEASNAYAAKRLEFQNRKETLICIDYRRRPAKKTSNKRSRVDDETILKDSNNKGEESFSSKEEEGDWNRITPNKFRGIRREKTGRWGASIQDPFMKRKIWLGTFDTPEEASSAFEAKRLEFLNRKDGLIYAPVNSSPAKRPRIVCKKLVKSDDGFEKSSTKEADLTGATQTRLIGAYRRQSGRWTSEVKDPFSNKRITLGMFDTAEEASNAFLAKKLEFQKRKEAGEQAKVDHWKVRKPAKEVMTNKFVGAYPRKSGKRFSSTKDPFTKRPIHLGDFDSPEEASNAYVAKKQEFLKLKEAKICVDGTQTECESVRSWEQSDQGAESSSFEGDSRKSQNSSLNKNGKEVDHKLRGVRLQKTGRWGAKIRDPFRKRDIWLGTFDTLDEASNVYAAKRLEFNQRKEGHISIDGTPPVSESGRSVGQNDDLEFSSYNDCQQREPQSLSVKRPGIVLEKVVLNGNKGNEKFKTKKTNLTKTTLNKFPGAVQRKSGKWSAEIIDPFHKRRIWFGSFDTPEEASNMCAAKKLEFLERKETQFCMDGHNNVECESGRSGEQNESTISSYHENDQLIPAKSSSINVKPQTVVHETLQNSNNGVESSSGIEDDLARTTLNNFRGVRQEKTSRCGAAINDPFTKRQIWLGTFDTPEEASKVYAAKRLEFNERKEAQFDDSHSISEPILIDSNGFLLGEFSNLDDELRIL